MLSSSRSATGSREEMQQEDTAVTVQEAIRTGTTRVMATDERGKMDEASLVARGHRNFAGFYQAIAAEHGVVAEADGVIVAATDFPVPWLNIAVATRPPGDPEAALAWTAGTFARRPVPWLLYAADEAAEAIGPAAERAGLIPDHAEPGMLLDPIPAETAPPPGLEIRRVDGPDLLAAYQEVFAEAYEAPLALSARAFSPEVAAALDHTLYVGFVDDRPVAIASRLASHRIAGIFAVGTIPAFRRRGLAAAMVRRAAADGRAEGCVASYLQSWEMGVGVYRGLGYRPVVQYRTWRGPAA
jgi:ribosomal protein S18 acetylase RimI-like enzyme